MTAFSKTVEEIIEDLNDDNSSIQSLFDRLTKVLFKGVLFLGIPLITYMLFQLFTF